MSMEKLRESQHRRFSKTWHAINRRCRDKNDPYYGGRGIKVEWKKFDEFRDDMWEEFLRHSSKNPNYRDTQIDRIDVNGNYSKENCRFVTAKENSINRRNTVLYECFGRKMTLSDWSRETGIQRLTIYRRIKTSGWGLEKALTTPIWKGWIFQGTVYQSRKEKEEAVLATKGKRS